jgi:hypothetical protein
MAHDDDILEYALNNGIEAASKRFEVPKVSVHAIVSKFVAEVDEPNKCACERAGMSRHVMCFSCMEPSVISRFKTF